jgi:ABC-type glutathione transport system ATPase component
MRERAPAPLLQVEDLCIGVRGTGARPLVEGIHFSLAPGEVLGIAGESGSGKTVTACALCGLLPPPLAVVGGKVRFEGREIDSRGWIPSGFQRGRDLLLLFQSPLSALDPALKVGTQVSDALVAADRSLGRDAADRKARESMAESGLSPELFHRYPFQLSGGQRQRVLLALAFGLCPRVLIADEPTAGLDDANRDRILGLLRKVREETGAAAVVVSHDLRVLSTIANQLLVVYRGQQVEFGPASSVFRRPGHPHTRKLLAAMAYLEGRP